jgi:GT2 family glycosyltransferase
LKTNKFEMEVVVVDNGSSDDSVKKIRKYLGNKSECKIIVNKENIGFAAGNNVGIRHALLRGADYTLILNNDTIVDEDLIDGLLKTFGDNPNAAAVSPKIYFAKGFEFHRDIYKESDLGKVIWYAGGYIDWDNIYGSNRGVDEVDHGQFEEVTKTDFATGACVMYKSQALKKVGFFDERYFAYFEDTDLSQRLKKAGYEVLFSPKAKIWHKVAQSSAIGGSLNDYFTTRNRLLFGFKYASLRAKTALVRESVKLLISGRDWQKLGVRDFYLRRFGKGSWR